MSARLRLVSTTEPDAAIDAGIRGALIRSVIVERMHVAAAAFDIHHEPELAAMLREAASWIDGGEDT